MQSRIPNYTTLTDFVYLPGYSDVNIPPLWSNSAFPLFFPKLSFIEKYCSLDLAPPPTPGCENSAYEYSSSNYYILGAILEEVTGKSYATLLKERIFDPLEMEDSGYNLESSIIAKRATGYHFDTGTGSLTRGKVTDMSTAYAAGAIYSTAEDLNKWKASLYTDQLLSDEYRQKLFQPYVPMCPNIGASMGIQLFYGYGFMIGYLPIGPGQQLTMIAHGGTVPKTFETFMIRIIENKYTIIVLSNTAVALPPGVPDIPTQIGLGIFQILYGMNPGPSPNPVNIARLPSSN
jgi:CubicO group peptidase (beta-lactamase class C family)